MEPDMVVLLVFISVYALLGFVIGYVTARRIPRCGYWYPPPSSDPPSPPSPRLHSLVGPGAVPCTCGNNCCKGWVMVEAIGAMP